MGPPIKLQLEIHFKTIKTGEQTTCRNIYVLLSGPRGSGQSFIMVPSKQHSYRSSAPCHNLIRCLL